MISEKKRNFLFNSKILNQIINNKKIFPFNGLAIDSRDVKKDNLFLALKGKNNDGNKFVSEAIKKGARYIVSTKNNKKYKKKIIKVDNPISFLNKFAQL